MAVLGCGSTPAAIDASAQDAATDDVVDDACGTEPFACVDASTDAPTTIGLTCADAGYFITVDGDGDAAATLSAGFIGIPVSYFVDCCGYTAMAVTGSAYRDGGTSIMLERSSARAPDGGITLTAGTSFAGYYRADGTTFGFVGDASLTTTFTKLDPPGGLVAGSYAVTVADSKQPDAAMLSLSGTFLTCRLDDAICACPPPPP